MADIAKLDYSKPPPGYLVHDLNDDGCRAQAVSVKLDRVVQATLTLVEAELTHGQVLDEVGETADHDLADVLIDALDNIAVTGDADGLGIAWNDGEIDADRMEEA